MTPTRQSRFGPLMPRVAVCGLLVLLMAWLSPVVGRSQTITYDGSNLPNSVSGLDVGGTSYDVTIDWAGDSASAALSFSDQASAQSAIQALAAALNTDLGNGPPPAGLPADGSLLSFAYGTITDPFTGGDAVVAATIEFDQVSGTWQFLDSGGGQGGTGFSARGAGGGTSLGFGDAAPQDNSTPVPEPASIVIWSLFVAILGWYAQQEWRRRHGMSFGRTN